MMIIFAMDVANSDDIEADETNYIGQNGYVVEKKFKNAKNIYISEYHVTVTNENDDKFLIPIEAIYCIKITDVDENRIKDIKHTIDMYFIKHRKISILFRISNTHSFTFTDHGYIVPMDTLNYADRYDIINVHKFITILDDTNNILLYPQANIRYANSKIE